MARRPCHVDISACAVTRSRPCVESSRGMRWAVGPAEAAEGKAASAAANAASIVFLEGMRFSCELRSGWMGGGGDPVAAKLAAGAPAIGADTTGAAAGNPGAAIA